MDLDALAAVRPSLQRRLACRSMGPWLTEPKDVRILLTNTGYGTGGRKRERACGAVGSACYKHGLSQCGAEKSRALEKADLCEL